MLVYSGVNVGVVRVEVISLCWALFKISNHVSFVPLCIGLDSLFSQGKPLADGYYTRHPESCTERK